MIEIIASPDLDKISYIDSNENPVPITDQNLIKTCQMMKRVLGTSDIFDEIDSKSEVGEFTQDEVVAEDQEVEQEEI